MVSSDHPPGKEFQVRNPAIALGAATLAGILFVGLLLFSQTLQLQRDVDALTARTEGETSVAAVVDDVRSIDARIDQLNDRLDDMIARFDRLDASVADLPTERADDSQIGTILSEIEALRRVLDGLSLDLGIVCDLVGC